MKIDDHDNCRINLLALTFLVGLAKIRHILFNSMSPPVVVSCKLQTC